MYVCVCIDTLYLWCVCVCVCVCARVCGVCGVCVWCVCIDTPYLWCMCVCYCNVNDILITNNFAYFTCCFYCLHVCLIFVLLCFSSIPGCLV